jgi:hypothetical protein
MIELSFNRSTDSKIKFGEENVLSYFYRINVFPTNSYSLLHIRSLFQSLNLTHTHKHTHTLKERERHTHALTHTYTHSTQV